LRGFEKHRQAGIAEAGNTERTVCAAISGAHTDWPLFKRSVEFGPNWMFSTASNQRKNRPNSNAGILRINRDQLLYFFISQSQTRMPPHFQNPFEFLILVSTGSDFLLQSQHDRNEFPTVFSVGNNVHHCFHCSLQSLHLIVHGCPSS
jgi:hypothetical protein